jgi:hypothetical protein
VRNGHLLLNDSRIARNGGAGVTVIRGEAIIRDSALVRNGAQNGAAGLEVGTGALCVANRNDLRENRGGATLVDRDFDRYFALPQPGMGAWVGMAGAYGMGGGVVPPPPQQGAERTLNTLILDNMVEGDDTGAAGGRDGEGFDGDL